MISGNGVEESVANRGVVFYTFIASLDEYQVRDLNDLINRRFREKRMWEERIKELGGPNYTVRRVHLIYDKFLFNTRWNVEKQTQ